MRNLAGSVLSVAVLSIFLAGCGEEAERRADEDIIDLDEPSGGVEGAGGMLAAPEEMGPLDPAECVGEVGDVTGRFYIDADESNRSPYTEGYVDGDAPHVGEVTVVGAEEGTYEVKVCSDGTYAVKGLPDGAFLIHPTIPEGRRCTTNNCPSRFAQAVADGSAVMVTFGDSVAVIGDKPLFPSRLASMLSGVATIENRNVAVPGTLSSHWLPDGRLFNNDLRPQLEDADLVIITLGGNDIMSYVNGLGIPNDIPAAIDGAKDAVRQVVSNVTQILDKIREINPTADVAYCLYPDYSQATEHPMWGLVGAFLGEATVGDVLGIARESFPTHDNHVLMVDMFGAADGLPLHDYLYDELHFNTRGQIIYAEELFRTLGGVLKGASPFEGGATPLGLERSFGLDAP